MDVLYMLNGIVSLVCAATLTFVVLHKAIHEGAVLKIGMLLMIFALLATAVHSLGGTDNWRAMWASSFTLRLGLLVVGVGFILRRRKKGSWEAALSDWGGL